MTKRTSSVDRDGAPNPFRRYAVAATGALAAAGVASPAEAAFLYSDVNDVTANAGESIFVNMASGEAGIGTPTPVPTPDGQPNWYTSIAADFSAWRIGNYFNGYDEVFINDFQESTATRKKATRKKTKSSVVSGGNSGSSPLPTSIALLDAGFRIDDSSFFEVDNTFDADGVGQWDGGGTGFLGLKMTDPSDGSARFGWMRLTYNDATNQMTLHDFAFSSDPIVAGQTVPEPSSLALFALGAAGLGALRLRNRK